MGDASQHTSSSQHTFQNQETTNMYVNDSSQHAFGWSNSVIPIALVIQVNILFKIKKHNNVCDSSQPTFGWSNSVGDTSQHTFQNQENPTLSMIQVNVI